MATATARSSVATPERGPAGFLARARELAERYGERFEPPVSLVEKAEQGETYTDEQPALATT
jgi:3-hydroxyacyl-CoA dehydrogenase/enoyl-CoA hydratase/3-hydroxybutyryl-CoA epimerase